MVLSSLKPIGLFSRRYPDAPRCRGFSNRSPADHSLLSHHGTLLTCAVSSRLSWSHLRSRGLGRRTRQPGRESLGPLQADREECVENVQGLESLPVRSEEHTSELQSPFLIS